MATRQIGQSTTVDSEVSGGRRTQITLGMTGPMAEALDVLSAKIDAPIEDVLTRAVVLLKVAIEAQGRGQRLCPADDDLNVKGEIVNFGAPPDEIGVDPFPERESDRLD